MLPIEVNWAPGTARSTMVLGIGSRADDLESKHVSESTAVKMKRLSPHELRMNEQAAEIAATVLGQPVEAATRCEQASTKAVQIYPSSGGEVWSKRVPNGTGLPKSFVLAVTTSHIYALEDNQHRHELRPGRVLKSWERAGFRAHTSPVARFGGVPDDRQVLMLFLPIDGDSNPFAQAIAQQRAAAGQRVPGQPHTFFIGTDGASRRVVAALGAQPAGSPGPGPRITVGSNANVRISPAANISIGGQRLGESAAQPARPPAAQRLQTLETLRADGVISDDEYARKRAEIIAEL